MMLYDRLADAIDEASETGMAGVHLAGSVQ